MSKRYPRKGEYGKPTFRCRWCGKEMEYGFEWYLMREHCSSACYSARLFPMFMFVTIFFGYISWMLIEFLSQTLFLELYTNLIIMTEFLIIATITSGYCTILGYKVRRATPKNPYKVHYDPRMVD